MLAGISVLNCQATELYIRNAGLTLPLQIARVPNPQGNSFKSAELMHLFQNLGCPPAQEIEARVGSDGFDEEQQIRRDDKYGAPWTRRLSCDMIWATDNKMIV